MKVYGKTENLLNKKLRVTAHLLHTDFETPINKGEYEECTIKWR
jgi:hypothetical protein